MFKIMPLLGAKPPTSFAADREQVGGAGARWCVSVAGLSFGFQALPEAPEAGTGRLRRRPR